MRLRTRFLTLVGVLHILASTLLLSHTPQLTFREDSEFPRFEWQGEGFSRGAYFPAPDATLSMIYSTVGGVLLRAVATPADGALPRDADLDLSYQLVGDYDARFSVILSGKRYELSAPAWVWAPAAKLAASEHTGAVTLYGEPRTNAELLAERRLLGKRRYWIDYHPELNNTLVGFFLLAADIALLDPYAAASITDRLDGFDSKRDPRKSANAAAAIVEGGTKAVVSAIEAARDFEALAVAIPSTYLLNDLYSRFVFKLSDGQLRIHGKPRYSFAAFTPAGQLREHSQMSSFFLKNERLLRELNPTIYAVVYDFYRATAFFRYMKKADPVEFERFVSSLGPVTARMPKMDTPAVLLR